MNNDQFTTAPGGKPAMDATTAVKETVEAVKETAEGVGATVRDAAQKLGSQAAEMGGEVYRQAADAGRYAGRQVEEQPFTALMAAGVVGILVGFLLGRASVEEPRSWRDQIDDYIPRKYWR